MSFASVLGVTSSPCTRICKIVVAPSSGPSLAADGGRAYAVNTLTSSFGAWPRWRHRLLSRLARTHSAPKATATSSPTWRRMPSRRAGVFYVVRLIAEAGHALALVEGAERYLGTRRLKEFDRLLLAALPWHAGIPVGRG